MRCKRFFGHDWSIWTRSMGSPKVVKNPETGKKELLREHLLTRTCSACGWQEERWLPTCEIIDNQDEE